MFKTKRIAVFSLVMLACGVGNVMAGALEDGIAAQNRGAYAEAARLFTVAAAKGNASAQYKLAALLDVGQGMPRNVFEAVEWYSRAAEQGHVDAQYNLALIHLNGERGEPDFTEAAKWLRKAARAGDGNAQVLLAVLHEIGKGVALDARAAADLYRKAAEKGIAKAQLALGLKYAEGSGVPQDYVMTYMWTNLAAAQGDPGARIARDEIISFMTPAQVAEAQRRGRDWLKEHASSISPGAKVAQ